MPSSLVPSDIFEALHAVGPYIQKTPLLFSSRLNEWLGAELFFKAEGFQTTGSFKARGAIYAMLRAKEKARSSLRIALFSSGNYAQGCAWAGQKLQIPVEVFMPESTSSIKIQATRSYGAKVTLSPTRAQAEALCEEAERQGAIRIPPFDHDDVIAGGGTCVLEALMEKSDIQALFAPCGGGGLLSGSLLAREALELSCKIYGCEPLQASDAYRSVKEGKILKFSTQPSSLADGARTPGICPRTFHYLKKLDHFYLASEQEIAYWCQWLNHLLKTPVEPTAALAMVGAWKHLQANPTLKGPLLIVLSGGNLSAQTQQKIWQHSWLETIPSRELELSQEMDAVLPDLQPIHL